MQLLAQQISRQLHDDGQGFAFHTHSGKRQNKRFLRILMLVRRAS